MKWRLGEGSNVALYEVGVEDDGSLAGLPPADMETSLITLSRMAAELGAEVSILQKTEVHNGNVVCEVLVRRIPAARDFMELRIAVTGGTDAGKSTLLGVLTRGDLDNGRGKARLNLLSHRHEIESGKTSSISHEIIGFDATGGLVNYASGNISSWEEICEKASRVISFVDLAGSEKYLRTTIAGLTGHSPNFVCLVVSGPAGVTTMTKEHLDIALAIDAPIFVVVTKVDCCTPPVFQKTLTSLIALVEKTGKKSSLITNEQNLAQATTDFCRSTACVPVFMVSCVSGQNLNLLTRFLGTVQNPDLRPTTPVHEGFTHFQVEDTYLNVPDVGLVVGGTMVSGRLFEGDVALLGPDSDGKFYEVEVSSIHRQRTPVSNAESGHHATLAFRSLPLPPAALRRGMSLVADRDGDHPPSACLEFDASVMVLQHPSTLKANFQGTLHVGSVRQNATVVSMKAAEAAPGEQTVVKLRFTRPEYLKTGAKLFFREGPVKIVGHVLRIYPMPAQRQ